MRRTLNSSRSHIGCQRCKTKKIKCDETTPACKTCIKAGVACPGVTSSLKWSRKHEKFGPSDPFSHRHSRKASKGRPVIDSGENLEGAAPPFNLSSENKLEYNLPEAWPSSWLEQIDAESYSLPCLSLDIIDDDDNAMFLDAGMANTELSVTAPDQSQPMSAHHSRDSSPSREATLGDSETNNLFISLNDSVEQPASVETSKNTHTILLSTFYRLSTPNPNPCFSGEHLVQHFFDEVCSLYSCFDSYLNPFRTLVAKLWTGSSTIYLAIQSMSIAHLANHYLYMAPLGRFKRSQAWKSLQNDLQHHRSGKLPLEPILLSLLLLGLSSSWHQPSNLGLQYLCIARSLIQNYLRREQSCVLMNDNLSNEKFFLDALMHWEMLASFVEPVAMMAFPGFGAPTLSLPPESESILPHPWTGLTTELHFALAEVGRILRRRYSAGITKNHLKDAGKSYSTEDDKDWAGTLERLLHSISTPSPSAVADYADDSTPKEDLINSAHACRYMGLLEIYKAFPHLLERKISSGEKFPELNGLDFAAPSNLSDYAETVDSCLVDLALFSIDLIKDTAIYSGACRLHPLILVSCGSHLRLPENQTSSTDQQNAHVEKILETRGFVDARMLALSRKYPHQQFSQMLDIVKETWQRLDDGQCHTHWLQVAHQNGWQTMMG